MRSPKITIPAVVQAISEAKEEMKNACYVGKYKCPECGSKLSSRQSFLGHVCRVHDLIVSTRMIKEELEASRKRARCQARNRRDKLSKIAKMESDHEDSDTDSEEDYVIHFVPARREPSERYAIEIPLITFHKKENSGPFETRLTSAVCTSVPFQ